MTFTESDCLLKPPKMMRLAKITTFIAALTIQTIAVPANSINNIAKEQKAVDIKDIFDEEEFQAISKRSFHRVANQRGVPWSCSQEGRWRYLGEEFYPSRIREIVCLSSSCIYGHYNCSSITYTGLILRLCRTPTCNDYRLPAELRSRWEFRNQQISVGCSCSS